MTKLTKPTLTLLMGPAGCGKTQHCTESFEEALQRSKDLLEDDLLFILPTAEHRARTIDLILRHGLPGFFQRRITTFDRALKEFLKLGGIDFATGVTRRMILKEILERSDLHYFDSAQRSKGFLNLIARTIVELKENLIRPGELRRKLAALKNEFPEFGPKYDDLCLIYEAYEKELTSRHLMDQRDSLRLLEEGLARGEFDEPKLTHVWIDGFSDFSKLQLSFIEFLTRHANHITVTLTLEQDAPRAPLFELVSTTQAALEDLEFKPKWMNHENHRAETNELRHLEKNLFRSTTPREGLQTALSSSIQIFEATGLLGEIEMIAREIKKLMRAHDYHFSDIAVLFRTTNPYVQVLQSVFQKFRIPFEIHERIRLKTTPVARTLATFLEIFLNDWRREDLFNFLKVSLRGSVPSEAEAIPNISSPLMGEDKGGGKSHIETPHPGLPPQGGKGKRAEIEDDVHQLELAAFEKGIFKGRAYWLKSFPQSETLKKMAACEDEFLTLNSAAQFSKWFQNMIASFGLLAGEKTRLDRESLRRIFLLLEELEHKHPPEIASILVRDRSKNKRDLSLKMPPRNEGLGKSLASEFLSLMEVDIFSIHGREKNKVQIYNVSLARQKEYKAVFLAGLLEKQFPVQVKEDPILSDAERRALNQKGQILKEQLPRQAFERYLFYLAVTRAREHLILSYPRFDLEGKEALPSFYVEEVRGIFSDPLPLKQQRIADVLPAWDEIGTFEEAETLVVRDLWQIPAERREDEDHHISFFMYNHFIEDPAFQALIGRLLKPIEGLIADEKIRPYFKRDVWSPTWLEEYAECPFRFFADRILKLEAKIEGVDIKRRGTILHDVLEHFFRYRRDLKREVSFEEAGQFCAQKFEELWNEEPLGGDRFYKIALERKKMWDMLLHILRLELVDQKPPVAGLVPAYFEFEFEDLVLKGGEREIKLRGKIDRIDVDAGGKYALVIDYKYGKSFKPKSLENGTSLQLPLYLIAVRNKLGLKPLGGHLYSLLKGASSGFHHKDHFAEAKVATKKFNHYSQQQFEDTLTRSVRYAEKFVNQIEHGEIPVRPRDCVSYCDYSTVCRIEKWRLGHIYRDLEAEDKNHSGIASANLQGQVQKSNGPVPTSLSRNNGGI